MNCYLGGQNWLFHLDANSQSGEYLKGGDAWEEMEKELKHVCTTFKSNIQNLTEE